MSPTKTSYFLGFKGHVSGNFKEGASGCFFHHAVVGYYHKCTNIFKEIA
jgi:hypothetical protein